MRAALILAAVIVAATASSDAEARGRRGAAASSSSGGGGRSVGVGAGVGVGVTVPVSRARASAEKASPPASDPAFIRPILPVRGPAQATASEPTRSASAGCSSGRLTGQGSGFCEIN